MNIVNNKFLFYVSIGLTASGSDGYDHNDADISALVKQIHAAKFSDEIKFWFSRARTGQVEVNPYWPRGSALAVACFFIDETYIFKSDLFFDFIENTGVNDPIGAEDFKEWITELPDILREIDTKPVTALLWNEYCRIVDNRSPEWHDMIKKAVNAVEIFFGNNAPEIAFNPNLFTPYSADFVRIGNRIITISYTPDAETMLHETIHTAVAKYRDKITAYAEAQGLGNFADKNKMMEFGYMENESADSAAHVIEECFVRAIAVTLSGGNDERLRFHAEYGCNSVPFIASYIRRIKLSYANLGELIHDVLDKMKT